MNRKNKLTILIIVVFALVACAPIQPVEMTEQDYYDEAAGWWLSTEQNFKRIYQSSTLDEQKQMLPFLKILRHSKGVLDMWQLNIIGGQPTGKQVDMWKDYKNDLIMMIANNYREKSDGG